jgi:hypothetical protein
MNDYETLHKEFITYIKAKDYAKLQEVGKEMLSRGFYEDGIDAYKTVGIKPEKTELVNCAIAMLDKISNKRLQQETLNESTSNQIKKGLHLLKRNADEEVFNSCVQKLHNRTLYASLDKLLK